MKKLTALLLAMVMCLSLTACGEDPNQPVIDAFNAASTAYDTAANAINEDIEAYPDELIDTMNAMADAMLEAKALLEEGAEIPAENAADLITKLADVEAWANDVYENLENLTIEATTIDLSKEALIEAFNYVSERFDAISAVVNEDIEAYEDEFIDSVISIAEGMIGYKDLLESDTVLTEEAAMELLEQLQLVDEWVASLEEG